MKLQEYLEKNPERIKGQYREYRKKEYIEYKISLEKKVNEENIKVELSLKVNKDDPKKEGLMELL
jgi:predicted transcriptional regulator